MVFFPFSDTDSNECEVEGSCDQQCTNFEHGFSCACTAGYILEGASHCRAINSKYENSHLCHSWLFLPIL